LNLACQFLNLAMGVALVLYAHKLSLTGVVFERGYQGLLAVFDSDFHAATL